MSPASSLDSKGNSKPRTKLSLIKLEVLVLKVRLQASMNMYISLYMENTFELNTYIIFPHIKLNRSLAIAQWPY